MIDGYAFLVGVGAKMNASQKVIAAFSEEQTVRLTGVSKTQLQYWDRTDFYKPSFAEENRRLSFSRVYSYKDIVALRVLNVLRNQYCVPLQHLRVVSDKLSHLQDDRWTGTKLYVFNKRVYWIDEESELPQEIASKQFAMPTIILESVEAATRKDVDRLKKRDKSEIGVIQKTRHIAHNAAVIAGTRIPVVAIKRFAEAGYSTDEIIKEYPDLDPKDVKAALEYEKPRTAA